MTHLFEREANRVKQILIDSLGNSDIQGYLIDNKPRKDGARPYIGTKFPKAYQYTIPNMSVEAYGTNPLMAGKNLIKALQFSDAANVSAEALQRAQDALDAITKKPQASAPSALSAESTVSLKVPVIGS